ncbi:MAG: hypothetical protein ABW073_07380, partial [Acidimicrobiia bacterium]
MPKATKRERQRQNRDARREAIQAEQKRRRQFKTGRNIVIALVILGALFALLQLTKSDDDSSSAATKSGPTNFATTCDSALP